MRSLRDRLRGPQTSPASSTVEAIDEDAISVWNTLYTLGGGEAGGIDDRGVAYLGGRPLSVEVWFGAGQRWVRGGSGDGLRQRRVDGLPIVETRQRVGEADIVQTAWADEPGTGSGRINIRLTNETDDAVIAAVVVRPYERLRRGAIAAIRCVDSLIVANGRPVVDLGRVPGDCATAIDTDRSGAAVLESVSLPEGTQAGSWQLADEGGRASLAAMIPLTPGVDRTIQVLDGREEPTVVPAPTDAVVRGWKQHLEAVGTIELPSWPTHLFTSLTSSVLGAAADRRRPLGDSSWEPIDDAVLVSALGAVGQGGAGAPITSDLLAGVVSGAIDRTRWPDVAAAVAAVVGTVEGDAVLTHEREAVAVVAGYVLSETRDHGIAASLIEAVRVSSGPEASDDAEGIVGKSARPGHLHSALLRHGWMPSSTALAPQSGETRTADPEWLAMEMLESLRRGTPSDPLVALRASAGSSWRWPRAACGDSPHVRAQLAIALAGWCRRVTASDQHYNIDLLPGMRRDWYGQGMRFSGLPVAGSGLSCALRWHGARPALLWEFDSGVPDGYQLTCTALDPEFVSTQASGEVLLNVPPDAQL